MQHTRDCFVEQLKVVANYEQCTFVVTHVVEQPVLGVDVEVVGGFVEQQHVATGKQDACQLNASTLTTREHTERQI